VDRRSKQTIFIG